MERKRSLSLRASSEFIRETMHKQVVSMCYELLTLFHAPPNFFNRSGDEMPQSLLCEESATQIEPSRAENDTWRTICQTLKCPHSSLSRIVEREICDSIPELAVECLLGICRYSFGGSTMIHSDRWLTQSFGFFIWYNFILLYLILT